MNLPRQAGWQLVVVEPDNAPETPSSDWRRVITDSVRECNLEIRWETRESAVGTQVCQLREDSPTEVPLVAARSGGGSMYPIWPQTDASNEGKADLDSLQAELAKLADSQTRRALLNAAAGGLCGLLYVEGTSETDEQLVAEAVVAVQKQLWTLDKPTERGAEVVTLSPEDRPSETWLLRSLGIPEDDRAYLAIIYGRGRCLGMPVALDEVSQSQLAALMQVCGRDCECDLDRRLMQGPTMIGTWDSELATRAHETLDFDPDSALVVAEVLQILARQGPGSSGPMQGGLIVHDLPAVEERQGGSNLLDAADTFRSTPDTNVQPRNTATLDAASADSQARMARFGTPALLVGMLVILAIAVGAYSAARNGA